MSDRISKIINNRTYVYISGKWVHDRSSLELDPHDPDYRDAWDKKNRGYEKY